MEKSKPKELTSEEFRNNEQGIVWMDDETGKLIFKEEFEWVCNECNFPNLTSSVSEDGIELELHACINCGCFEMHKEYKNK